MNGHTYLCHQNGFFTLEAAAALSFQYIQTHQHLLVLHSAVSIQVLYIPYHAVVIGITWFATAGILAVLQPMHVIPVLHTYMQPPLVSMFLSSVSSCTIVS